MTYRARLTLERAQAKRRARRAVFRKAKRSTGAKLKDRLAEIRREKE